MGVLLGTLPYKLSVEQPQALTPLLELAQGLDGESFEAADGEALVAACFLDPVGQNAFDLLSDESDAGAGELVDCLGVLVLVCDATQREERVEGVLEVVDVLLQTPVRGDGPAAATGLVGRAVYRWVSS